MENLLVKDLPVEELIAETDAYMVSLGYAPSTMRHFRQAWNALKNLALRQGEHYFTQELGYKLLKDHYRIDVYAINLTESKSTYRRAVLLLLEYQISGTIAKRNGCRDHSFPDCFLNTGEEYLIHLNSVKPLKEGTLKNHRTVLESLFKFLVSHGITDLNSIDIAVINIYLKTMAGYSKSHISGQLNMIRRFLDFAYDKDYMQNCFVFPEVSIYEEKKIPAYYTAEECQSILNAIDRANGKGKRDYAMILLGVRYGLRISDIKDLKFSNIDFKGNGIHITQVKTGKQLSLDLLPDVGWAIIDYLKNGRPETDSPNIFVRHVVPYTSFSNTDCMNFIIKQYARAAGITKANTARSSFHMLRYGLASTLLQKNVSLTTISSILGHSELNITTKYTQIDVPQLEICSLEVPNDLS
jgi:site-specific recombinase XerD